MNEVVYSLIVIEEGAVIHTGVFRHRGVGDQHLLVWLKEQYPYHFYPKLDDLDTTRAIATGTLGLTILYRTEPVQ